MPGAPAGVVAHLFRRHPFQRVVQHLHPQLGELAEIRHGPVLCVPEVPHHPDSRVVDLQHQPGVGDGAIFLAHGLGQRPGIILLSLVVQVRLQRFQARRRHHAHERLRRLGAFQPRLESRDVGGDLRLAAVGDLSAADHLEGPLGLAPAAGGVLVELAEVRAVLAGEHLAVQRPHLEAGHAAGHVVHPGAVIDLADHRLGELPVADDVDPGL